MIEDSKTAQVTSEKQNPGQEKAGWKIFNWTQTFPTVTSGETVEGNLKTYIEQLSYIS